MTKLNVIINFIIQSNVNEFQYSWLLDRGYQAVLLFIRRLAFMLMPCPGRRNCQQYNMMGALSPGNSLLVEVGRCHTSLRKEKKYQVQPLPCVT